MVEINPLVDIKMELSLGFLRNCKLGCFLELRIKWC